PLVAAKFDRPVGFFAPRWLRRDNRGLLGVAGRFFVVRGLFVFFLFVLRFLLIRFFGEIALADVLAVADAQHHDHVIGLFLRENIARHVPPIEIALGLVTQQTGMNLVLADDGDLG